MPMQTRDPFQEVSATPRHSTATPRRTSMPRPSYSSSFVLFSVNSRIRYFFCLDFQWEIIRHKIGLIEDPNK